MKVQNWLTKKLSLFCSVYLSALSFRMFFLRVFSFMAAFHVKTGRMVQVCGMEAT